LSAVLTELRNIQEVLERRLRFCLEARDPDLLRQVALEAEAAGLGCLPLAREAASLAFGGGAVGSDSQPWPHRARSSSRPQGSVQHSPEGSPSGRLSQDSHGTRCWHARRDWRYAPTGDDAPRSRGRSSSPSRPVQHKPQDPCEQSPFGTANADYPSQTHKPPGPHLQQGQRAATTMPPPPGGPGMRQGSAEARRLPSASPRSQPSAAPHRPSANADYTSMSSRELLQECRRLNLNTSGCAEREDLIGMLNDCMRRHTSEQSAASPKAAPWPPPAGGFRSPSAGVSSRRTATPTPATAPPAAATPRPGPGLPATVWDRQRPPLHLMSKRSQALYLLGLETGPGKRTGANEVRTAYRRVAMECHPDRLQNHARQQEAKALFQKVKEAFDFLGTPAGGGLY